MMKNLLLMTTAFALLRLGLCQWEYTDGFDTGSDQFGVTNYHVRPQTRRSILFKLKGIPVVKIKNGAKIKLKLYETDTNTEIYSSKSDMCDYTDCKLKAGENAMINVLVTGLDDKLKYGQAYTGKMTVIDKSGTKLTAVKDDILIEDTPGSAWDYANGFDPGSDEFGVTEFGVEVDADSRKSMVFKLFGVPDVKIKKGSKVKLKIFETISNDKFLAVKKDLCDYADCNLKAGKKASVKVRLSDSDVVEKLKNNMMYTCEMTVFDKSGTKLTSVQTPLILSTTDGWEYAEGWDAGNDQFGVSEYLVEPRSLESVLFQLKGTPEVKIKKGSKIKLKLYETDTNTEIYSSKKDLCDYADCNLKAGEKATIKVMVSDLDEPIKHDVKYTGQMTVVDQSSTKLTSVLSRFCVASGSGEEAGEEEVVSNGDKSNGDKSNGDKSNGDKSNGDKGNGDKGNGDKSNGDKGNGDKSNGDKSNGDKSNDNGGEVVF
jgi:predicted DNA-binding antitoxin AbrB/MazE fold protein